MEVSNELVQEVKIGNKEAFSELFRLHYPRILQFLVQLLKDKALAEEISQDVFFRLWINREKLNPELSMDAYLYQIARNKVINLYKKKEVERKYLEDQHSQARESAIEDQLNYKELQSIIDQAVEDMPPQQRTIYKLSREQGLQNAEIAGKLGISKRTVEKHISNSLQTLRAVIEKNYMLFFI